MNVQMFHVRERYTQFHSITYLGTFFATSSPTFARLPLSVSCCTSRVVNPALYFNWMHKSLALPATPDLLPLAFASSSGFCLFLWLLPLPLIFLLEHLRLSSLVAVYPRPLSDVSCSSCSERLLPLPLTCESSALLTEKAAIK